MLEPFQLERFFLKRIGIALLSTRLAFRGYEVACFNQGYLSSPESFFSTASRVA